MGTLMHQRVVDRGCQSWVWLAVLLAGALSPARAAAQTPPGSLSLNDAVELARRNYPSIKESRARAQAAEEGVGLARAAYLPRLDLLWQENRATSNNVFGLLLPQTVIPNISGPVLGTPSYGGVWGSAAGVQLSWDAIDFGVRKAGVDVARAHGALARARIDLTELDVAAAAADGFVTVLAADEAVRAARANVDRLEVFANAVRSLVQNQLRPGADESRSNAELAIARNQLSQTIQSADLARATLADAVGAAGSAVEPAAGRLARPPDVATAGPSDPKAHPASREAQASVEMVRARARALDRSYFPKVVFQSAFAARGSGAEVPGLAPLGDGLWPQVSNWAAGLSVTFPAFDVFPIKARKRVEAQNELAESARYDQTLQALTTQQAKARALMKAALDVARNTPIERQAATDAESRARARYQNGLANITEVAEAQRLLAQAEADDAVARLAVWRALLAEAQARGDLAPFLEKTR